MWQHKGDERNSKAGNAVTSEGGRWCPCIIRLFGASHGRETSTAVKAGWICQGKKGRRGGGAYKRQPIDVVLSRVVDTSHYH